MNVADFTTDYALLTHHFIIHLNARNRAPGTVRVYRYALEQFRDFLAECPGDMTLRRAIEAFLAQELKRVKPATVSVWYRSVQQFFKWAADEEEIVPNPMAGMSQPVVPVHPVPVLSDDQIEKLMHVLRGRDFRSKRDNAIIRLFLDTGARLNELATAQSAGVKLDKDAKGGELLIMGKGRKPRWLVYGAVTADALNTYQRSRDAGRRLHRELPDLWIAHRGAMTRSGLFQVVRDRGLQAGIEGLHPHRLRHTWAHRMLMHGMNEVDVQQLAGWASPQMLRRYGASAADERARVAARRLALGDRY